MLAPAHGVTNEVYTYVMHKECSKLTILWPGIPTRWLSNC